jgi:uncharacterized repeat protein (TIGR03803 family)
MSYKKVLGVASAVLMIVIVLTLALAPAARAADKYKALHAFHVTDGANPDASLILDAAGNLYGTTYYGGAHRHGTVFKLAPSADGSWTESVLHSFNGSTHQEGPTASLIFDAAGNLYGTTLEGGDLQCLSLGCGTVFKLTPNADGSWTESVLHTFHGGDGELPRAGLIFDVAGSLYGTTQDGGTHKGGTVFKLTPNADGSWTETVLHSFNGSDGRVPLAGLIFDAAGNLYGTTSEGGNYKACPRIGCGLVFKLTPNTHGSWTESVLHSFNGIDGAIPVAGLIFDAAGNLYSTTSQGGAHNLGNIFKLTANADGSWTESVLHSFNGIEALNLPAGLIFDALGNLYSTTIEGGAHNLGNVIKLAPKTDGSWTYSSIYVFQGKPASGPFGSLVLGSAGTLYGTTAGCGTGCKGVVYQITP